jgi:cyclomaltodextrinase
LVEIILNFIENKYEPIMKILKPFYLLIVIAVLLLQCAPNEKSDRTDPGVPEWANEAIWYQIFVERFRNGDTSNDPVYESIQGTFPHEEIDNWTTTPWTHQWGKLDSWANSLSNPLHAINARRYGGDLQGVLDKMDYIEALGVNTIYFNPLNDAPSLHKYDAANYRHIDRHFGPTPDRDVEIMQQETPDDPATWQWTGADSLFLEVVKEFHKRNIRVVLDYSWNHTGMNFWAFKDVMKNGENSKYADWYEIESFDDPATKENEFHYKGWAGVSELPEFKRTITNEKPKYPIGYLEGNLDSEALKQHIFNVSQRWLDPNGDGDPSDGIDGFRLDVAAEIPMGFWNEYRDVVKGINPDAILIGEVWWEEWPDRLLDPRPWLIDGFDATMNYRWYREARKYFAQLHGGMKPSEFIQGLNALDEGLDKKNIAAMMNMSASHDSPRISTSLYNKGKYKVMGENYKADKPDAATRQIQKMLLMHQFTYVGGPQIWAGDELGMWGADDPHTRKPLIWDDYEFEAEDIHPIRGKQDKVDKVEADKELHKFYTKLCHLRSSRQELLEGALNFVLVDDENSLLAYSRFLEDTETISVFNLSEKEQVVSIPTKTSGLFKAVFDPGMEFAATSNQLEIKIPAGKGMILISL